MGRRLAAAAAAESPDGSLTQIPWQEEDCARQKAREGCEHRPEGTGKTPFPAGGIGATAVLVSFPQFPSQLGSGESEEAYGQKAESPPRT